MPGSGPECKVVQLAGARFRGGLFFRSIEFRPDRVVFHVFTSRPTSFTELQERFELLDSLGTDYVMEPFDDIDGQGVFAFVPAMPPTSSGLQLREPGGGLLMLGMEEPEEE